MPGFRPMLTPLAHACAEPAPAAAIRTHTMTSTLHDHVLDVHELVDQPGASRRVDLAVAAPGDLDLPLADLSAPVRLGGVLESVVEGILVRGHVAMDVGLACSRCLEPVGVGLDEPVTELYADPSRVPDDAEPPDEGFELRDGRIDLDPLVRDAIAAAIPAQPRCRPDCAGLCPQCGANRNEVDCDCSDDPTDTRWAALRGLRLPAGPDDTARAET